MNLIESVRPIIGSKTAKVVLEVSANPKVAGEMVVVVRPLVGPVAETASEELKQLMAALATPIKIIGTPEVIERDLAAAVSEQAGHRSSWSDRAAALNAMIAGGASSDAKKSGSGTPKTASPAKPEAQKQESTASAENATAASSTRFSL